MTKNLKTIFGLIILLTALMLAGATQAFEVTHSSDVIAIITPNYKLEIIRKNFRYGFFKPDGSVIAKANADYGLEFGGGKSTGCVLRSNGSKTVVIDVTNNLGAKATVEIFPAEHFIKFSVTQSATNRMVARSGGISPAFGLADHAALGHTNTEVTGIYDDNFRAQEPPGDKRLISNFVISPRRGIAVVNMERETKIVHVTERETGQGVANAAKMPALYYFFGTPQEIYRAFLDARNREGFPVYRPKYEFFGVGWEAFGALGWKSNEQTVSENVERYLALGYPLEWMVVGSGFWPNEDPLMRATTSFGMWDKTRYPDPKKFVQQFKAHGLKVFLGLRISFIDGGPNSAEGVAKGYFLKQNGVAKAWKLGFPKLPAFLLDTDNPDALKWYIGLCQKWLDYGVDGFKEDLFGYKIAGMSDGSIDKVNRALMDKGVFIMGRNGYLGSAMDTHRINDFNYGQNQDRGPINVLAFAYSGFPYAYPDIIGGTFGESRKMPPLDGSIMQNYLMRSAQFDSVNPSMAVGMGPWNFGSKKVEEVVLEAAKLHARLHPYIYSAAIDAYETGFPSTMTPLPIAFPNDPQVYGRENPAVRGYEWMFGPSLLATPLYGNDFATASNRDVYLPAGKWMDYDTGEIFTGPKILEKYSLPVGKTPMFVGGKGVLITKEPASSALKATVYPVMPRDSVYKFTDRDGATRTNIENECSNWNPPSLKINDTSDGHSVAFEIEQRTGAVKFNITPGHDYRLSDADNGNK